MGRQCRHSEPILHVGDGARRRDGLRADHFLHHGFRLFRRRDLAASSASREDVGVGRVLDRDRRRRDGPHPDPDGASLGALHLLSPAHRKPLVLYRACACRGGLLDLVRSHARRDARVETRKSRETGAIGDVRDGGKRRDVALDHRWRRGRTGVSGHPGIVGHRANHRCGIGAHAVLMDAACHRLLLAHPRIYCVLHDHPARGGRPALQRHDGPSHLHPVPGLQPSRRDASSDDGPPARQRLEVHSDAADRLRVGADSAHDFHHHGFAGDRRTAARRPRRFRLDRQVAVGPAGRARDRPRVHHARLRRLRRTDQHGLRHERDGAQHLVGHGAFSSDFRRLGRDHVFRDRIRDMAAPHRPRACLARPRCDGSCGCGSSA